MENGIVYVDFSSLSTFFSDRGLHIRISVYNFNLQFLLSFLSQNYLDFKAFTCYTVFFPCCVYASIKTTVFFVQLLTID